MKIWDISRPLTPDLAPWPGDERFQFHLNARKAEGSSVNLGAFSMSVHNGTHADAPFHFSDHAETIDQMPLAPFIGATLVVDLSDRRQRPAIEIAIGELEPHAAQMRQTGRLLLKTNSFPNSERFPDAIPVLAPGAAAWLAQLQVLLLGVDVPSVDRIDSKELVNHHALQAGKIAIIESLDLRSVEGGIYQLAALPLPIAGGDGSPVRAILWRAQ